MVASSTVLSEASAPGGSIFEDGLQAIVPNEVLDNLGPKGKKDKVIAMASNLIARKKQTRYNGPLQKSARPEGSSNLSFRWPQIKQIRR